MPGRSMQMKMAQTPAGAPPAAKGDLLAEAIAEHLPGFVPAVIFDVGANTGATAVSLCRAFPDATVYAFEPVADTFGKLAERAATYARIKPFNLALGKRNGRARMHIKAISVGNRLAPWWDYRKPTETVEIASGDAFCREHAVAQIGFLKIDTEGHDLEVLRGFRSMLKEARIDLLEAEVGMNPENERHVPLEAVKMYVERLGYRLFLIYEQARETAPTRRPIVRRVNAVFCSPKLLERVRSA